MLSIQYIYVIIYIKKILFSLFSFSFFFICGAFTYHSVKSFICIFAAGAGEAV